ncbi:MAG: hypothetical protein IT210_06700 [Armatimonadetes bacterium]|nr:hypothetical protein [Armatimonadota bacterium]
MLWKSFLLWSLPLAFLLNSSACGEAAAEKMNWQFAFKPFVIGAWWGPDATDAELKLYREAGFNVVMIGRYMQLADYADLESCRRELDLAKKHKLGVMFDTYTKNDRPWGGQPGPNDGHPLHHAASLAELEWLYEKIGKHPALVGFMVGDDQGEVSDRASACTSFLYRRQPHLFPWLCGWIPAANLAAKGNPIANPQIYPTLYSWNQPAGELARQYAASFANWSHQCRQHGILFWPMINISSGEPQAKPDTLGYLPSDSLVRFPAYAAIAYGAQGLWYFVYNAGALQTLGPHRMPVAARQALTPMYPVVKAINRRISAWGPKLLGRVCSGVFSTAFGSRAADYKGASLEGAIEPASGKLCAAMDSDLLVGILTRPGAKPLAMVVDARVSKGMGDLFPRRVSLKWHPDVTAVQRLEGRRFVPSGVPKTTLTLEPGGGQLLELDGRGLNALCAEMISHL